MTCAECGQPLDGESRFWCRKHYRVMGTGMIRITQETLDRLRPGKTAFSDLLKKVVADGETGR